MNTARWMMVGVLGLGLAACQNTADAMKKDAEKNAEATKGAEPEAREAARDTREAAGEAGGAIDAAKQTMDVKAALMADATINANDINVDTSGDTKTVTLTGKVPDAAAKTRAETIAKSKAEGYTIVNNLQVAAGARAQ